MTHERDIERLLDHWLDDGATEAPDRVLEIVADRIERQPQRRAWRFLQREIHMNGYLKPVLTAAAILVIALVGFRVLSGGPSSVGRPGTSPLASPSVVPTTPSSSGASASPSASVCDDSAGTQNGCAGPLAAGAHSSAQLVPPISFSVPNGWENVADTTENYWLRSSSGGAEVRVYTHVAIADQTPDCAAAKKAGVGNAVQDWIDYLGTHPGLAMTAPVPARVGGYDGQTVQISVKPTWTQTCPFDTSRPFVVVLTDSWNPTRVQGLGADGDMHLTFLDVGGQTVIVDSDGSSADMPTLLAAAQPVIDSIRFPTGN